MKNYNLKKIKENEYYLICLSYYGFLNSLEDIENEKIIVNNYGKLIIDQLLVTGDSYNRFISCDFFKGKIKLETAKNIKVDFKLKKITSNFLKKHFSELPSSILTDNQLKKIFNGQAI